MMNCKATGSDIIFKTDSSEYWTDININGDTTIMSKGGESVVISCAATPDPTPSPTPKPLDSPINPDGDDSKATINYLNIYVFCTIIVFISTL